MKNKKVLFLDMDATTLDDEKRISQENMEAMRAGSVEAGHEVVIATGRTHASAGALRKRYGLDQIGCRYMIVFNGAAILDCETGKLLYSRTLPVEYARELVDAARQKEIYIQTYSEDQVLTEKEDENLAFYLAKTGMTSKLVPDLKQAMDLPPYKMLAVNIRDFERLDAFRMSLSSWAAGKADMYFSCREYLEIVSEGVCKGDALKRFCRLMDIPIVNTIAAGDECNDISMLLAAGTGCAVSNALEEVKEAADYVTERDNNHSAIAEIIDRFI